MTSTKTDPKGVSPSDEPGPIAGIQAASLQIAGEGPTAAALDETDLAARRFADKVRRQARFWLVAMVGLVLFLYVFRTILLPFLAGMAIAYFLDPVADRLERIGLSRLWATIVILVVFVVLFVLGLAIIVPALASQTAVFIERLPGIVARLQELLANVNFGVLERVFGADAANLKGNVESVLTQGAGVLTTLLQQIWASGMALVNLAGLLVVTPVVAFYMLLDWDHMVEIVDRWIPRDHVETVREIAREIDAAIAGFVRGQSSVCLSLGVFYAVGLSLVGLNFGLLIGLFAGLVSFIPYVGSMSGLVLSLAVAAVQFWPDWPWVVAVAAVFFAGQFLEGNILQPKLVGGSVGLHPVWLMFALFAFGALFGFVGLLVAVPAAAVVGVLARFALRRYLASPLYHGHHD